MKHTVWIDAYRGFLMMLVVFGHLGVPMEVFDGLRLPAFFFVSGYLFSESYIKFSYFFKRRFRQIIVPYVAFFLMVHFSSVIILSLQGSPVDVVQPILAMLYGSFSWDLDFSKPLWFVTALFTTEMCFFFIKNHTRSSKLMIVLLLVFSFFGYLTTFLTFRLPWGIDIMCSIILFYGLGYLAKTHNFIVYIKEMKVITKFIGAITLIILSYYFSYDERIAVFVINKIPSPVYTIFSGITGIIGTLMLFKVSYINQNNFLIYLGKNTFIILAFHEFLMHVSRKILLVTAGLDIEANGFMTALLYVLLTFILIIPVIEFINRFLPFILNRKR